MRNLSSRAVASANDHETGEVWLTLLTIEHPSLAEPMRFVDDKQNIASRGNTYLGFPFSLIPPDDDPQKAPTAKLEIDNTDRRIVEAVRSLTSPPTITVEWVLASQPDVIEMSFENLTLAVAPWDAGSVTGELAYEDVLNEPIPGDSFTPSTHPGLF